MTVKETAERAGAYASDKLHAAGDRIQEAGVSLRDAAGNASASVGDGLSSARDKVADAYDATLERTGAAYDDARDRAGAAYASARQRAGTARTKAGEGLDESPLAALIGGVAIGILVGAFLPRSQRETEALAPIGDKLATLAKDALSAAREAGTEKLDELGLNKEGARDQMNKLVESASEVASTAGSAAAGTLRKS